MGWRQDIADAFTTLPGITGHALPPANPRVGDAWPLLSEAVRAAPGVWQIDARVLVLVGSPGDPGQSIAAVDGLLDALLTMPPTVDVGWVARTDMVIVPTAGGDRHAVEVAVTVEHIP